MDGLGARLLPGLWHPGIRPDVVGSDWEFDARDPIGSIDRWDCEHRQRRLILSELRTYAAHGRWLLPFYDYALFDFYRQVPLRLRYQQRLYIQALLQDLFTGDLAVLARIPLAHEGTLKPPRQAWQDRLLMHSVAGLCSDCLLRKATHSKQLQHLRSVGEFGTAPSGPDPLDYWWHEHPAWQRSIRSMFTGWDGMQGLIDVSELVSLLDQPLPRLFIQFGVPALLTLRFFQRQVERTVGESRRTR
jgi:hypothetical protein